MSVITLSTLALACQLNAAGDHVNKSKCMNTISAIKADFYSNPEVLDILNMGLIDCKNRPSSSTVRGAYIVDALQNSIDATIDILRITDMTDNDKHSAIEFIAYGASGWLGGKWDCKSPRLQN